MAFAVIPKEVLGFDCKLSFFSVKMTYSRQDEANWGKAKINKSLF